jgi:threonine/homoserine/homoserine lactone efflux protein
MTKATRRRKTISAWTAFSLTEAPQDGPMSEADTAVEGTPKDVARAPFAASLLSPAASVWMRTLLPPMTVAKTLPPTPACATADLAFSS